MLALIALTLIIVAVVVVIALFASSKSSPKRMGKVQGCGKFDIEVVGESHYLANLKSIAGRGEVRLQCTAVLVLDPNNPHDANAVRVMINGLQVGHLSRKNAAEYRSQLQANSMLDVAVQVDALIIGGGRGRENLGVRLDLPVR